MNVWAQLHYPISVQENNGFWTINIKGTPYNVLHNDEFVFVTFRDKDTAMAAFDKIKEIRSTVKYIRKIMVNL